MTARSKRAYHIRKDPTPLNPPQLIYASHAGWLDEDKELRHAKCVFCSRRGPLSARRLLRGLVEGGCSPAGRTLLLVAGRQREGQVPAVLLEGRIRVLWSVTNYFLFPFLVDLRNLRNRGSKQNLDFRDCKISFR